ncbi:IclR family transcriptional regulator [Geobacillus thermodenitrificans]|uniref:IclR family transcriptional regulator n=1 Tax=Geobacillus thermodenitrificans TaxID=33940 RepID=UPI000C2858AA|nr:IclR family transcriptional regulator [Geobacillus thermodenitrificans]MED3717856.1 IclR family transcriptional regulator [Geobacillus thermodenitrificans]MED4916970.1 IclR family transcriptional regulator [Geobacillus thermodenitrificans]PJW20488.1 IclR family transcriptional regulator [Geobacillus thermodenitrificans]
MEARKGRTSFSSLENALRLLQLFSMDETELSIADISERLYISKSTAHRLLQTLKSEGFIKKDGKTNLYSLGTSLLAMKKVIHSRFPICQTAFPFLQELVSLSGESAHIATLYGADVIYLHKVECDHPIRLLSYVGKKNPAFCTSTGQAILAYQPRETIDRIIAHGLPSFTSRTITSPSALLEKLAQVKQQGYAISKEELHEGVTSISAPIRTHNRDVRYSISIAGPIQRINDRSLPHLVQLVVQTAQTISAKL